jgi:hypothetical protein
MRKPEIGEYYVYGYKNNPYNELVQITNIKLEEILWQEKEIILYKNIKYNTSHRLETDRFLRLHYYIPREEAEKLECEEMIRDIIE